MINFSVMSCEVVGTMFWRSIVLPSSGYKMEATVHGVISWAFDALRPPEEGAERQQVWGE
jgi:hypothetical protein